MRSRNQNTGQSSKRSTKQIQETKETESDEYASSGTEEERDPENEWMVNVFALIEEGIKKHVSAETTRQLGRSKEEIRRLIAHRIGDTNVYIKPEEQRRIVVTGEKVKVVISEGVTTTQRGTNRQGAPRGTKRVLDLTDDESEATAAKIAKKTVSKYVLSEVKQIAKKKAQNMVDKLIKRIGVKLTID